MKIKLLLLFLSIGIYTCLAQSQSSRYKTSAIIAAGTNAYFGDICGNCLNSGYGVSVSSRFKITNKVLFRPEFGYQHIKAQQDPNTKLQFANNLWGAILNFEFGLHQLKPGKLNRQKKEVYVLVSPFVFHHNPFSQINNTKTFLAPLETEGKTYSKLISGLRLGVNFQSKISSNSRLGFQVDYNILASDYVDDVSKEYIDYTLLDQQRAKAIDPTQTKKVGTARGNKAGFDSMLRISVIYEFSFTRELALLD